MEPREYASGHFPEEVSLVRGGPFYRLHEKWILRRAGQQAEFLEAPESSRLADFGQSYKRVAQLRPFLVDRGALVALAIAVALPALPVILTQIPLIVVIKDLLKALR
jgi:hypothetical protein